MTEFLKRSETKSFAEMSDEELIQFSKSEAEKKYKFNRQWYRADSVEERYKKLMFQGSILGNFNINQSGLYNQHSLVIRMAKEAKLNSSERLRFSSPVSFMFFEELTLDDSNISGLIEHYNLSKGCRSRLDYINSYSNIFELPQDTHMGDLAQSNIILDLARNEEFMSGWNRHEFKDSPKWSSYKI